MKVFALWMMSLTVGQGRYGCCTLVLHVVNHSCYMI
jgi:hypothetical protein